MQLKKIFSNNKGTTLIIFTLMLTTLFALSALVIDIARVETQKVIIQKTLDSVTLAAAQDLPDVEKANNTITKYLGLNNLEASDVIVNFWDSNETINISSSKEIKYTFAKVLGFNDIKITLYSTAQNGTISGPFNYTLFSGSRETTLSLNGANHYINGHSHTNKNFVTNGANLTITGLCEALTTISINGSKSDVSNPLPNSSYVSMPDFSAAIIKQAEAAGQCYTGNKIFSGSNISLDSPIYVNGNVTIQGAKFKGIGFILASGNITFNGSNVYANTDSEVCFYSQNGSIKLNGSNAQLDGVLYAPKDSITLNGSNQVINGRVIGNTVVFNGGNIKLNGSLSEKPKFLPKGKIKLVKNPKQSSNME